MALSKQDLAIQFTEESKNLANTLLRIRNSANAWHIQNAIARLGEVEYWANMAFTFDVIQETTPSKGKEVKFANKGVAKKQ